MRSNIIKVIIVQNDCGRPWPATYITFMQITHQSQVLTEPLRRAQVILFAVEQERGTKKRGLTYSAGAYWVNFSAKQTCARI